MNETDGLDQWQNDLKVFGICSFSLSEKNNILENPLMWSHYAEEHKGVCLFYQFPTNFINYDRNNIFGISKVEYKENPLTDWFINNAEEYDSLDLIKFLFKLGPKTLTIKSPPWEYEEEVRMVRPKKGFLKIEKEFLKQICFGLNTPDEDKKLIIKIVSDSNYQVTFCEAIHGESDFGLTIREI